MSAPAAGPRAIDMARALPLRLKLAWGMGQLAPYTIFAVISAEIMLFLTDHVGITPVAAGLVLFTAKIYDIFTDIAVGLLSDRIDTRWGRRRPWMFAGAILIALATVGMFRVDTIAPAFTLTAATVTLVTFYTGYAFFTIAHIAMGAEIGRTYQERTSLQAIALTFSIIAGLLGNALAPALIVAFGSGTSAFHTMGLVMAVIALTAGIGAVIGTSGAPAPARAHSARLGAGLWLRTFFRNRPLLILATAKLAHFFATSTAVSALIFYAIYVLDIGQLGMVTFGFASAAGGLCGVVLGAWVSRGRRKHIVYAVALIAMGLAFASFGLVPKHSRTLFAVPSFLMALSGAPALMMAQSMLADIVAYDQARFQVQRAGAVSSLITALQKTTPALSALYIGAMLSWGGYVAGQPSAVQPESAITAITASVTVLPFVLLILAAAPILLFYRLDEHALAQLRATATTGPDAAPGVPLI